MGLKLYCNRYTHFKDPLVCSVVCQYRTRCQDFALFYDEHRESVDALVAGYFASHREAAQQPPLRARTFAPVAEAVSLRTLIRLEVKQQMAEAAYIWIGKEDQAELLSLEEIIRRAERGTKAKHIYKVAQEMELRFQLVPRKSIEKARRIVAADAERAAARRARPPAAKAESLTQQQPAANATAENAPAAQTRRRKRSRPAKIAGEN